MYVELKIFTYISLSLSQILCTYGCSRCFDRPLNGDSWSGLFCPVLHVAPPVILASGRG